MVNVDGLSFFNLKYKINNIFKIVIIYIFDYIYNKIKIFSIII
jgi:hypothetical protein